jgi:hypothetical protein
LGPFFSGICAVTVSATGRSVWELSDGMAQAKKKIAGFDLHHSEIILGALVIALLILMVVGHWTLRSAN